MTNGETDNQTNRQRNYLGQLCIEIEATLAGGNKA